MRRWCEDVYWWRVLMTCVDIVDVKKLPNGSSITYRGYSVCVYMFVCLKFPLSLSLSLSLLLFLSPSVAFCFGSRCGWWKEGSGVRPRQVSILTALRLSLLSLLIDTPLLLYVTHAPTLSLSRSQYFTSFSPQACETLLNIGWRLLTLCLHRRTIEHAQPHTHILRAHTHFNKAILSNLYWQGNSNLSHNFWLIAHPKTSIVFWSSTVDYLHSIRLALWCAVREWESATQKIGWNFIPHRSVDTQNKRMIFSEFKWKKAIMITS